MDPNTGTIFQFQSEEEKKKMEEDLETIRKMKDKIGQATRFGALLGLGNLPKPDCEFCAGAGAVRSTITMKWIPCRCTNPT